MQTFTKIASAAIEEPITASVLELEAMLPGIVGECASELAISISPESAMAVSGLCLGRRHQNETDKIELHRWETVSGQNPELYALWHAVKSRISVAKPQNA